MILRQELGQDINGACGQLVVSKLAPAFRAPAAPHKVSDIEDMHPSSANKVQGVDLAHGHAHAHLAAAISAPIYAAATAQNNSNTSVGCCQNEQCCQYERPLVTRLTTVAKSLATVVLIGNHFMRSPHSFSPTAALSVVLNSSTSGAAAVCCKRAGGHVDLSSSLAIYCKNRYGRKDFIKLATAD